MLKEHLFINPKQIEATILKTSSIDFLETSSDFQTIFIRAKFSDKIQIFRIASQKLLGNGKAFRLTKGYLNAGKNVTAMQLHLNLGRLFVCILGGVFQVFKVARLLRKPPSKLGEL